MRLEFLQSWCLNLWIYRLKLYSVVALIERHRLGIQLVASILAPGDLGLEILGLILEDLFLMLLVNCTNNLAVFHSFLLINFSLNQIYMHHSLKIAYLPGDSRKAF